MKKVLFLIPNLAHGGAERVLVNLVNHLDRSRYQVTVQTLFDMGDHRRALLPHVRYIPGWKHQFRGNSHVLKLFSPEFLYRRLIRERYDVVVSYLEGPTARIVSGCPDGSTRLVGWVHIELPTPRMAAVGFRSVREALQCYGRYDRLAGVSRQVRASFLHSLPVSTPMEVLYNTNESEQILQQSREPVPERMTGEVPTICSVAKLMETKGFDRLLRVHRRLLDAGFPHRICLVGTGEKEKELRTLARQLHVQDSFVLLGFRQNPYAIMARCDFYVCSSRREGFSTAVTEALILGIPVVSTDCSGAAELLGQESEYGLVVENSEEGLYQGMKQLLENPDLLAHYRAMARQRGSRFSRERTVQAVEKMLDELCGEEPRQPGGERS